jgi:hypothetical protein
MTMITLDSDIARQEHVLEISRSEVQRLLAEITNLRTQLEVGEIPGSTALPDIKRLSGLVATCLEAESRLGKFKEQRAGIAQAGFAFDLETARCSISAKLDRLRGCQLAA